MLRNAGLLSAMLIIVVACGLQRSGSSATTKSIASNDNIIFYRIQGAGGDFIARRQCPRHMENPAVNCAAPEGDALPLSLFQTNTFRFLLALELGGKDKDEKYYSSPAVAKSQSTEVPVLERDLAVLNSYLSQPGRDEAQVLEGKKRIAALLAVKAIRQRVDRIIDTLTVAKVESLPDFSEEYKALSEVFAARRNRSKLYVFDSTNRIWWVYLGIRNYHDAAGLPRNRFYYSHNGNSAAPIGTSCAAQFGGGYRLPSGEEIKLGLTNKALMRLLQSSPMDGWIDDGRVGEYYNNNLLTYTRTSTADTGQRRDVLCVISG